MNQEYNQQLKDIFRANTKESIKLGVTLALSQGYSWNDIAIKCLEEWLLFKRYDKYWNLENLLDYNYAFVPNQYHDENPGMCIFMIHLNNETFRIKCQLFINGEFIEHLEGSMYSDNLTKLKEPCIEKMKLFIQSIYEE